MTNDDFEEDPPYNVLRFVPRWGDPCFTRDGSAIYMGGTTSPDIAERERETILAREVPRRRAEDKKQHSSKYVTRISQNTRLERRWGCL